MGGKTRKTGIDILGDVPWGTHFCQFYLTKKDLIDILVPYFKAGLENNEFCMWITSEPLSEKEAKEAMREALPDFDRYLKREQIEILPHEEWYLKKGAFNTQRVLKGWVDKLDQALAQDYDGLRLTGNTFWLEKKDWRNFTEYEKDVNNVIGKYRMMAICSYSLDKCEASEVIDVVSNHQFALIRKEGKWKLIESSERRKAEDTIKESEKRYRQLFEGISDAVMVYSSQGKFLDCNEVAFKRLGYNREKFLSLTASDIVHPDFHKLMKDNQKRIWAGETTIVESAHRCKDGRVIPVEVNARRIEYKGEPAILAVVRDITDRKRAEEELRKSRDYLERLTNSMWDAVFSVKMPERVIEWANDSFRLIGYDLEECIGRTTEFLYPDESEFLDFGNKLKNAIATGKDILHAEQSLKRKTGEVFPAEVTTTICREKGEVVRVTSIIRDITERKRTEEELKSSQEQLRNLVARLQSVKEEERRLIAREIHDELGQTLTVLKMDLFWLAKRIPKDQRPFHEKTKSMSKLIDKTIQRIKRISAQLRPGLLDYLGLPAAIEWEGEEFQNRTGIKCEVNIDSEDIIMEQDRSTAIFRIFQETLTNAARHANAKKIKVSLKEKAGKLELRVRDNGKGITEKQISDPKSFGLIGMRERAQFLGGEVKIRGVQDKGTTIIATVPLIQKEKA